MQASKVIFATNAYTGGIVPLLSNKIVPIRATVCRILPSTNYMLSPLKLTYGMRSKGEQFDYLLPRQTGDQSIILGGSKPAYLLDRDTWYNNWDDSTETINEKSKQYFEDFMPNYFDSWGIDYSVCNEV